jgi:hypothetical protein
MFSQLLYRHPQARFNGAQRNAKFVGGFHMGVTFKVHQIEN